MIARYLKHAALVLLKYLFDFDPHLCLSMFALVLCIIAWTKQEMRLSMEAIAEDGRAIAKDLKVLALKGRRQAEAMLQRISPTELS